MDLTDKHQSQRKVINRRQFLKIFAISGIAGLSLKLSSSMQVNLKTNSETRLLMGTLVNLTVVTADALTGKTAIQACFEHMSKLEAVLSRYNPNSEVSILNRQGYLTRAAPSLIEILKLSKTFSLMSGGAFDITIKPILDLYAQNHTSNANLPSKDELTLAKSLVDYHNVIVEGDQVSFTKPGMEISLDGIAKGYIVDQGVSILRQLGFDSILVEAGGDLYASGDRNPGMRWNIGVRSPRGVSTDLLTNISVTNQSVATSGDYMNTFSPDFNHHHIIDPHTGHSNKELSGVTVIYPHTAGADALATSIMVLGVDKGLELANSLPDCEAMLITKDLKTLQTDALLN